VTVGNGPPDDTWRELDDGDDGTTAYGRDILQTARGASTAVDVVEVGSTGVPAIEPLVLITDDGETAYHTFPSLDSVNALVERAESGDISAADAAWVVTHDPEMETLPVPADGPLSVGSRRITGRCGWIDPYGEIVPEASATAFARDEPDGALRLLDDIGLLGRGRGDASQDSSLAAELGTVRETPGEPVVVVNANESDRQNLTDRLLLEGDPSAVVDGLFAVAAIVGATPDDTVVYTNETDNLARRRMRRSMHAVATDLDDGTGDESAGGYAAGSSPDEPGTGAPPATDQGTAEAGLILSLKDALPARLVNGLLFVAPPWFDFGDLLVAGLLAADLVLWGGLEWWWSERSLRSGLRGLRARFD
jgi:NADH-quinone oxidoreductase subunit F